MQNDIVKQPQEKQLVATPKAEVSADATKDSKSQPNSVEAKPKNPAKPENEVAGAQVSQPKNNSPIAAIVIAIIIFLVLASITVFSQIQS